MSNVVRLPSASSAALQAHKLAPLLMPKRVALVGASPKEGTVGNGMIVAATIGEPVAEIVLVNPNYPEIGGRAARLAPARLHTTGRLPFRRVPESTTRGGRDR